MDEPPPPAPIDIALQRMTARLHAGSAPRLVTEALAGIVAEWAAEPGITEPEVQQRVQRMWESVTTDAADLQAQISDAEEHDPHRIKQAQRILAAMHAAIEVLTAIMR